MSVSVCQCVSVSESTRQGRVTQFANGAGDFLSSIIVRHGLTDTQSVLTETTFKHLIRESSLKHTLHSLQYCNSARRDSRRKSTSEPKVADRETQTHNNRKSSFFSLSLSAKSGQQTLTPHALLHTQRSQPSK